MDDGVWVVATREKELRLGMQNAALVIATEHVVAWNWWWSFRTQYIFFFFFSPLFLTGLCNGRGCSGPSGA